MAKEKVKVSVKITVKGGCVVDVECDNPKVDFEYEIDDQDSQEEEDEDEEEEEEG